MAVEDGEDGTLKSLGIKNSELGDVKVFLFQKNFLEKLVNTGFVDRADYGFSSGSSS